MILVRVKKFIQAIMILNRKPLGEYFTRTIDKLVKRISMLNYHMIHIKISRNARS